MPPRRASLLLGTLLAGLSGCADDPRQIEAVQAMASALHAGDMRAACRMNVRESAGPVLCPGVINPLLHYSPGFVGSQVTRRGRTSGWRFSSRVVVPVRYDGPAGRGALDVTMRREDGAWRIVGFRPLPSLR